MTSFSSSHVLSEYVICFEFEHSELAKQRGRNCAHLSSTLCFQRIDITNYENDKTKLSYIVMLYFILNDKQHVFYDKTYNVN